MSFTKEQEHITLDILSKDKHAFYDILKVERTSDDNQIKKSYRKMAIKLHPDKNPHPKASEAFKVINRAFEVLSDQEKRNMYDRIGRDPDERGAPSAAGSGFSNQAGFPNDFENMFFRGRNTGAQRPPEDIFDFLFNTNVNGSPFGGPFGGNTFMDGGATGFSFGGPGGFRVFTNSQGGGDPFFQQRQRQRQSHRHQQQNQPQRNDLYEHLRILIPFILLFLVPMLERLLFG